MNILLVEDEARVANFIQRGLSSEGWSVTHLSNGEEALMLLEVESFDALILDLMLPGTSGHDVCKTMRARENHTPILMLTALGNSDEMVKGLKVGADDYLAKPFDFDELVARLYALHRRAKNYKSASDESKITFGDICLDRKSLLVSMHDKVIDLTKKEREILQLLLSSPDRAFSRERILSTLWAVNEDPLTNVVDVYIARLRKKLPSTKVQIQSVRGVGYRMSKTGQAY